MIDIHIAVVAGPSFGIIDVRGKSICYQQMLKAIPIGLINLSQIILIMDSKHASDGCCRPDNPCGMVGNIPADIDCVCQSYFPVSYGYRKQWKNAPISVAGSLAVGKYLNDRSNKKLFNIGYWNIAKASCEIFKICSKSSNEFYVSPLRDNFQTLNSIEDQVDDNLYEYLNEEEIKALSTTLRNLNAKFGNIFRFNCVEGQFDCFEDQYDEDELIHQIQVLPSITLDIGEVHSVIPIFNTVRNIIQESTQEIFDYFELYNRLFMSDFSTTEIHDIISPFFQHQPHLTFDIFNPSGVRNCGWSFLYENKIGFDDYLMDEELEFATFEPNTNLEPFGSSASGALACAITYFLLSTSKTDINLIMRGLKLPNSSSIGEALMKDYGLNKSISINKIDDEWRISAEIISINQPLTINKIEVN